MKRTATIVLGVALLLFTLAACSGKDTPEDTDPATTAAATTAAPTTTAPRAVSEKDITVAATPISLTARPEFAAKSHVTGDELISLHGYTVGMTFAQTQAIWEIPQDMIDYAAAKLRAKETPDLYIYVGNMAYSFAPGGAADSYSNYILEQIYYGETTFCESSESLGVLRDVKLGDMVGDVLKSLPGNRTPKKWAIDQLYGEYGKPDSASLEYTINTGFYTLEIYCESSWARLTFGSSGKLWFAEIMTY